LTKSYRDLYARRAVPLRRRTIDLAVKLTVNGQGKEVAERLTVGGLIRELGLERAACAAEVNRELVPKRQHEARELRDGDAVELVTLVGGG
jgi:thiamine biosynthesis protein ThiS